MRIATCLAVLAACSSSGNSGAVDAPGQISSDAPAVDATAAGALPTLAFCTVADATNVPAAFTTTTDGSYVSFACATPCTGDWSTCTFGMVDTNGAAIESARGGQIQGLAFVVDGMGGHFAFTSDGDDVVITHSGGGGSTPYNAFDHVLQATSSLKTVTLGWEIGGHAVGQPAGGWFTRKDANATTVHDLTARPAAAIAWVKQTFAAGHKLGTVGASMGTAATFGAHVWQGLDASLDYQMLVGGPGFWDVNIGCGRVHTTSGHCDADATPCTGNAMSNFGNDDPACAGGVATNSCRVPTVMAQLPPPSPTGSLYDDIVNYVGVTTSCMALASDARDATLDASSMAFTVGSWSFHGRIDFIANEGAAQPPNSDQGMGEGHMLDIYTQIQSAKSWTDVQGTEHTASFDGNNPTLIANAAAQVVAGMQ